jgi:hypothetical protein
LQQLSYTGHGGAILDLTVAARGCGTYHPKRCRFDL